MNREVIGKCPICENQLKVTKLSCPSCNTNIEGDFDLCKFCKLSREQKHFLDVFVKNRGNIKEIEKELGISYPTVKNKLEDLIQGLGHNPTYDDSGIDKREVLKQLDEGHITTNEALQLLKNQ